MLVSLITVTYNNGNELKTCIRSVRSQTHSAIQYIVVDGGSTDGTLEILSSQGSFVSNLISEPDHGIYDAMNKGLSLARGEVVGFLNSDDFYNNSEVISRVVTIFSEDSSVDACYSDLVYVDKADVSRVVRYWKSSDFSPGTFVEGWCPPHPTFFVRRRVYERYGSFDLSYRLAADSDLMLRFLEIGEIRVRYIPEVWVKMRTGGATNRNLKNIWLQNQEILRALRSHGMSVNPIWFFGHKFISRYRQFFLRPSV